MQNYDIVIVGAGHNALVAACYLAQAGKKILILEKNDYIGGATTSQRVFPEYDARLSRYSYLVSLFPQQILDDLSLDISLLQRKIASYTPYTDGHTTKGLLISNQDEVVSKQSVLDLGFGESEWEGYQTFLQKSQTFAELTWDSFLKPLRSRNEWKQYFAQQEQAQLWDEMVERPIGELIEHHVQSDVMRGVLMTDAKIGSYTHAHDESLLQNRTFLYHIVGNKTGEWRVPKGGMGALANALIERAKTLGIEIKTQTEVTDIKLGESVHSVEYQENNEKKTVNSQYVLMNVLPKNVGWITGQKTTLQDEGTAFKINLLLERLPRLKDTSVSPSDAFAGTFHINELYSQMERSYAQAHAGELPEVFPCEIYCHTLTDPSILGKDLQRIGYQTITVFGIDMACHLFETDNEAKKEIVVQKFFDGINTYLAEPMQDCLAKDSSGNWCIEAKSSIDLQEALGMPRGNIFHGQLSWFFTESDSQSGTWGVETPHERVFLCGSAAMRGGAVSGIPGRSAAMKILGLS